MKELEGAMCLAYIVPSRGLIGPDTRPSESESRREKQPELDKRSRCWTGPV